LLKFLKRFITVRATECGHKTRLCDKIEVIGKDGETKNIEIEITTIKPSHCHKCVEKMAIRCAWCGEPILVGDPITLYKPKDNFKIPEYAMVYKENTKQVVGCLRRKCCYSGADRSGFWVIPGKVERVLSPFEQALMTGKTVIISDISDINQTITIED